MEIQEKNDEGNVREESKVIYEKGGEEDSPKEQENLEKAYGEDADKSNADEEYNSTFKSFQIKNMVCNSCEIIIEKSVSKLRGVHNVKASYAEGTVDVSYNAKEVSSDKIIHAIKEAGYRVTGGAEKRRAESCDVSESSSGSKLTYVFLGIIGIVIMIFGYIAVTNTLGKMNLSIPQLSPETSIALIFIVGLLTGFHCIGMCGGFVLGYTAKAKKENPKALNLGLHGQYAIGKLISYSVIGGIFGLIGSVFVFSPTLRAGIAIFAGAFLILYGLKMLNIFPVLRKFSIPQGVFDKLRNSAGGRGNEKNKGPFVVGLLNGLFIACGPLQAMYILAMATGSFFGGAALLLAFAIGTLIPMLGFGVLASFLSHSFQNNIVRASAVIVLVMGLFMINSGLALTGNAVDAASIGGVFVTGTSVQNPNNLSTTAAAVKGTVDAPYQIIHMDVTNAGYTPNSFVLKKGVPVKWVINGKEINGCNGGIRVPAYNLDFTIKQGEQTIEFTPDKEGVIQWSCWMGMIHGTFVVRDDVSVDSSGNIITTAQVQVAAQTQAASAPKPAGGSCGCGGSGASTCQMKKL
ncbi:Cytochrome C biogenesis protein transmembrane region [uncultured archaeon]|nr:Cytochrome C biogenesis protein transmembrane region [uncultured archaeon]